ncbi:MAG: glycosyltransferase, partial [Brevundimonas sp.]|nr:glycosyltransferase [Brevundimonas sp.]
DGAAYLQSYPDVAEAEIDPLLHFVMHGMNEARQPSPPWPAPGPDRSSRVRALLESGVFSSIAYEQDYPDVVVGRLPPAEHYVTIGQALGRAIRPRKGDLNGCPSGHRSTMMARPPFRSFGTFEHDPMISIIIVSFNSGRDLAQLLPSIARQAYQNFEVICIENGTEDTEPLLHQYVRRFQYQRAENVGFAAANNLAVSLARGEMIALVNPDTMLDPDMLRQLVQAMRRDKTAAVVVPKIYFFEKFVQLSIKCDAPFSMAANELLADLSYQKHFVRTGRAEAGRLYSNDEGTLELELPFETERVAHCVLKSSNKPITSCLVSIGHDKKQQVRHDGTIILEVEIEFAASCRASARYLVNNAGSGFGPDGTPFDRGFGEEDEGAYFTKTYVDAMCGCAALIRRTALIEQNLFVDHFFAYFEDSEFSFRLGQRGYRVLYNPAAIIYHRHSETTEENSLVWQVLVSRSRTIYDYVTGRMALPLRTYVFDYPEEFNGPLRDKLEELDHYLGLAENLDALVQPKRRSACIYNSYFSTMGGGEKHALDLANILSEEFDVYIASETDFCLDELSKYFNVDLKNARKIVSTNIDSHFTSIFDVFVNCTFRSNLASYARHSLYVVSFPHRDVDLSIIERYQFLHNSNYTKRWAEIFWGEHRSCVLLPILGQTDNPISLTPVRKQREILSVGRFTPDGHCKNQHLIVEAFKQFVALDPSHQDWRLRLIGSCNWRDARAREYLDWLKAIATGLNVSIEENVGREQLADAYASAAIYVHATGVGLELDEPELHEHFGISSFEAMMNGCLPVVYAEGGPAEQVENLPGALTYHSAAELAPALASAVRSIKRGAFDHAAAIEHAAIMLEANKACAHTLVSDLDRATH